MPRIGYWKFRVQGSHFVYDTTTNSLVPFPERAWELLESFLEEGPGERPRTGRSPSNDDDLEPALSFLREARDGRGMFQPFGPKSFGGGVSFEGVREALETRVHALGLNLTDQCNQRCTYCVYSGIYSSERTHGVKQMSWEVARKAVDYYLARAKPDSRPSITFYGGEPLMNWEVLARVTSYLRTEHRSRDIDIEIATNLTLLTRERLRFLMDNGVRIQVSIDGPEAIHDECRIFPSGKGTHGTVMNRLALIRNTDPDFFRSSVSVVCTVAKGKDLARIIHYLTGDDLLRELPASFGALRESEVDGITVSPRTQDLHGRRIDQLLAEYAREMAEPHSPAYHGTFHNLFWFLFTDLVTRKPGLAGPVVPPNRACIPGTDRLFVSTEGKFFTCEKFDLEDHSIGDVENGVDPAKAYRLLRDFSDWCNELCQECWAFRLCTQCYLQALEGPEISKERKMRSCEETRREIQRGLERFAFLWMSEPESAYTEEFSLHYRVKKARSAQ